jgi:hypothetical protein
MIVRVLAGSLMIQLKTSRRTTAATLGSCLGAVAVWLASSLGAHGQDTSQTADAEKRTRHACEAWGRIVTVLQHPRCLNCHQQDYPLQGDDRHVHVPTVMRGRVEYKLSACDDRGLGVDAMGCAACHNGSGNNETSGTPGGGGDGLWSLAPARMTWQGLSSEDICKRLKDPKRNMSVDRCEIRAGHDLVEHMATEPLVVWAWQPGGNRTPIPIPHDVFVDLMKIWVEGGMPCPGDATPPACKTDANQ